MSHRFPLVLVVVLCAGFLVSTGPWAVPARADDGSAAGERPAVASAGGVAWGGTGYGTLASSAGAEDQAAGTGRDGTLAVVGLGFLLAAVLGVLWFRQASRPPSASRLWRPPEEKKKVSRVMHPAAWM